MTTVTKYSTKPWVGAKKLTTHAAQQSGTRMLVAGGTTRCGKRIGAYSDGWWQEGAAVDCRACARSLS